MPDHFLDAGFGRADSTTSNMLAIWTKFRTAIAPTNADAKRDTRSIRRPRA